MKNIKNFITLLLIYLLLVSCRNKEYINNLPKSKITLELYTNQGIKLIKSFVIPTKDINTLEINSNENRYHQGFYNLYYWESDNSFSGSVRILQKNVAVFKILKIENDLR